MRAQILSMAWIAVNIFLSLQHQGRHLDGGKNRAHIDLGVHPKISKRIPRTIGKSLQATPPPAKRPSVKPARRNLCQKKTAAPFFVDHAAVVVHPFRGTSPRRVLVLPGTRIGRIQNERSSSLMSRG